MRVRTIVIALIIVYGSPAGAVAAQASTPPELQSAVQSAPLVFEPNEGQERAGVKFLSRAGDYSVALMNGKAVLRSAGREDQLVTIQFSGSNPSANIEGVSRLSSKTNYLIDPNPKKWHRNIANYARAQYQNLYPGIDVVFYGDRRNVEYDFVLSPGANPDALRLKISGARIEIDRNGDLLLHAAAGEFRQRKPVVYQLNPGGHRVPVAGSYALDGGDVVFRTERYDCRKVALDINKRKL